MNFTITTQLSPIHQIVTPAGYYHGARWLSNDTLVFNYELTTNSGRIAPEQRVVSLWTMNVDGREMQELALPIDNEVCKFSVSFHARRVLSDGRLMFIRFCATGILDGRNEYLMVWKPEDNTSQFYYSYELPTAATDLTFAPDLSKGIASESAGIVDQMFWIDAQEATSLNVGMVRARGPSWSPDGQSIVFMGNRQLRGSSGPSWAVQPYDLWLMPTDCQTHMGGCSNSIKLIVHDVGEICHAEWSPDSAWITFDGELQGRERGVWLLNLEAQEIYQVAAGDYRCPGWSPDGQRLLVSSPLEERRSDISDFRTTLNLIDVSEIVSQNSAVP